MTWIAAGGAAVSAAGGLAGALGKQSAAAKKNRILSEGSREQARAGGEAAGVMGDFMQQLRASHATPEVERGVFNGAIRGGPAVSGPITASRQFQTDANGATTAARGYGTQAADWLARLRAPGLQRQRESQLLANAGNAIRPITSRAADEDFMTQYRAGDVKENPIYGVLGQGLQAAGNYAVANPGSVGKMFGMGK